jgi:hypothetical protein
LIRVVKGRLAQRAMSVLESWVKRAVATGSGKLKAETDILTQSWLSFKQKVQGTDVEQLQWRGRDILKELELIICGCILITIAFVDQHEVPVELARRWIRNWGWKRSSSNEWRKDAAMDKRIFLGCVSEVAAQL